MQREFVFQQMRKRRFESDYLSVDRTILPYHDLREALYEERIEFPKYMTYLYPGDAKTVEIAFVELSGLTDTGTKIDHQPNGSKDVTDAMAGVCYTLLGDRQYRRGVIPIRSRMGLQNQATGTEGSPLLPNGLEGLRSVSVPTPPSLDSIGMFPSGLQRPRKD